MSLDRESTHLLIVTPVKDEIDIIEAMVESVLQQTVRFREWVILDDGSIDGTRDVLRRLAASVPSVSLIQLSGGPDRRLDRHLTRLVERGLDEAKAQDWLYWAKLDADVLLAPDYFERILDGFADDPKLGIASGSAKLPGRSGRWRTEWTPDYFPLGMARVYRRACWTDIGGFTGGRHFDIIDVYAARYRGWHTVSLPETTARLLRRVDAAMPGRLRRRFEAGRDLFSIGYLPAYFFLRATRSMWDEQPQVLAGWAMMCGYLLGAAKKEQQVDDELFQFVRREQRSLLGFERLLQYWRARVGGGSTGSSG